MLTLVYPWNQLATICAAFCRNPCSIKGGSQQARCCDGITSRGRGMLVVPVLAVYAQYFPSFDELPLVDEYVDPNYYADVGGGTMLPVKHW
jgi:hypothetical protein